MSVPAERGARRAAPDPIVGAWRMDWFADQGQEGYDPRVAAEQDATPTRWLVLTADGRGALVSADGVTVLADAMLKRAVVPQEPGTLPHEAAAPVEPPIEFVWLRAGDRYFARATNLPVFEPVEAAISGGRLLTSQDTFKFGLKRDPHPPAGVERRLRGGPSPVAPSPPRFWDFLK